jgi:small-conductance mechanosensitive channel
VSDLFEAVADFFGRSVAIVGTSLGISWGNLIFLFVLPLVGIYLLIRLVAFFLKRLLRKSQLSEDAQKQVYRVFRIIYRLGYLVAVVLLAANLFGDQIVQSLGVIVGFLNEPFFTSGSTTISVITLLLLIPIFYAATWVGNATRRILENGLLARINLDASRQFSVVSLVRYAVMTLVTVIGLSVIGVNLSSLAVIFGVLGIGIGFGLQGVVANFFAGVMIILSRPIKEGDRVHIGDLEGDVQQIKLLYSVINTITNETLIIPNRNITENNVHNQSYDDPSIVLFTNVQVSYRSDLDKVQRVLMEAGSKSSFLIAGRSPRVLYRSFDDSGITVTLAVPINHAVDRHVARSQVMLDIWRAFRDNAIEIPFPQMDLYVKQLPQAPEETPEPEATATDAT